MVIRDGAPEPGATVSDEHVDGAIAVHIGQQAAHDAALEIVQTCTLPITSTRRVDLIVTELAVIRPTVDGLVLQELAPGVDVEQVQRATGARLIVPENVPCMSLSAG